MDHPWPYLRCALYFDLLSFAVLMCLQLMSYPVLSYFKYIFLHKSHRPRVTYIAPYPYKEFFCNA